MPSIRLDRFEASELPPVCIRCGGSATLHKDKSFSWYPPWVAVLILAGLAPYLIVAIILTKRMTVAAPLCDRHKGHWFWRTFLIVASFLGLVGLFVLFIVFAVQSQPGARDTDMLAGIACAGAAVGFLFWVIAAIVLQMTAIRPTEITDHTITLTGVAPDFIDAVRADRKQAGRDEEVDPWRRPRPRDAGRWDEGRRDEGRYYDPDAPRRRRPPDDAYDEERD
jgi:hypothetical protein